MPDSTQIPAVWVDLAPLNTDEALRSARTLLAEWAEAQDQANEFGRRADGLRKMVGALAAMYPAVNELLPELVASAQPVRGHAR